ncbi:VaFE repeat-containing surface-anchored protein [Bacillus sp. CDB3]|uniref:VaFE repeat-containing surface-anchored protein n=1 Tax=Bacillus sp. CDB3 TaxID=360310 RepID=UPI0009D86515|nr:VaFE repeat-containing surface-anchored protein [Bacillus sp. CDB3]OQR53465.1 collagen-binding protein [Bacillus sp. CDB3]
MGKKYVIRILALLSVISLFFNLMLPKANAEVMTHEKYAMDWSYSNQLGKHIRTELIKAANGQIAYCLTFGLKSPDGQDLPEIGKTDNIVYRVLLNGYPQKSPSELGVSNWQEAHYSTQLAIWNALGQLDVNELKYVNTNVEKATKSIINAANNSKETQDISMDVVPSEKQKAELKGDFFETNLYTVQTNAKGGTFTIQTNNAPDGVKIINENGEVKNQFTVGEKFRMQIPKTTKTGGFNLKVISNLSKVQAIAYKGTDTIQNTTVLLERNEEKISRDLTINWESLGSLQIKKVGEQNEVLKGAVFEVFNTNNESVGTMTTGENGTAVLSNLSIGAYTIKEIKAPEGHILNPTPQIIEIKTGETASIQLKNESIKGNIEIKKLSDNGKVLTGVEFTIFTEDGKAVTKVITNKEGIAKKEGLTFGKYYFQETQALDGYVPNNTKYSFEIKEHNKTLSFEVKNQGVTGGLEITKVDVADGNNKLLNAEFTIFNAEGKEVVKGKTNAAGIAKFEKLPFGKYTYRETLAPEGYVINEEMFSFEIKENGEIIKHVVADEKIPSVKTTATDKTDGTKEMHTSKSVTIQDKVEYKDLIVGKEYVVNGKLMDKATNKPLIVNGKEVTAETKFTPEEANGSITLDFTFDATGLEEKEVVVFENVLKDGKVVTMHADINDKNQTVKFVKSSVKTTATNKADGSKELDATKSVTIQDKVGYKDLIVGKEYVVKGKLMDKATNKPLIVNGKEVTAESKFTAKEKDGYITLEFTFNASELQGKEVVVFEELYQDGILVAIHSDIEDMGQTVKFKEVKLEQSKPEQPQVTEKQPEQPRATKTAKSGVLPVTGGDMSMWFSMGAGLLLLALGTVLFIKRRDA